MSTITLPVSLTFPVRLVVDPLPTDVLLPHYRSDPAFESDIWPANDEADLWHQRYHAAILTKIASSTTWQQKAATALALDNLFGGDHLEAILAAVGADLDGEIATILPQLRQWWNCQLGTLEDGVESHLSLEAVE